MALATFLVIGTAVNVSTMLGVSYPGVSNVSEKSRKKRPMSSSRNGTWEGLALAQRTLGTPFAQPISCSIRNPLELAWERGRCLVHSSG